MKNKATPEKLTIYVWEDGSWASWDDDYHDTQSNPEYLHVSVPKNCKDIDAFAKTFAEDYAGYFPNVAYNDDW